MNMAVKCVVVVLAAMLAGGCASEQAKKPARAVASSGVDEALKTLSNPESQKMLDAVASSPAVQRAAQQVGHGLLSGSMEAASASPPLQMQFPRDKVASWAIVAAVAIVLATVALIAGVWFIALTVRRGLNSPAHA